MIDIDFINILRLDSCFKFLSLQERIHLHQSIASESYFNALPQEIQKQIYQMSKTLKRMKWDVPAFYNLREDEEAQRYWVFINRKEEISEQNYANLYKEKFEQFQRIIKTDNF